jgi:hypothetical protein
VIVIAISSDKGLRMPGFGKLESSIPHPFFTHRGTRNMRPPHRGVILTDRTPS